MDMGRRKTYHETIPALEISLVPAGSLKNSELTTGMPENKRQMRCLSHSMD